MFSLFLHVAIFPSLVSKGELVNGHSRCRHAEIVPNAISRVWSLVDGHSFRDVWTYSWMTRSRPRIRSHFGSRHGTRRLVLPRDLFDFPVDVASLVIILLGELLRTCSSVVQEHFQGLAQAGRYLLSAGLISLLRTRPKHHHCIVCA